MPCKTIERAKSGRCPLYPRKRTSLSAAAMSALCQKRTSGLVANNRERLIMREIGAVVRRS